LEFELARYVMEQEGAKLWTGLSYALFHGSWSHVLMNSVWLAAFGTPVARRCGVWRFLLLASVTAFAGALVFVLMNPLQALPLIGASAAVSGMMAAAAWFAFSRPVWLLEGRLSEPHERPRESLAATLANRQVLVFLGVWFATNAVFALIARPLGITDASIAWEAHLGGFLAGLVLFPLLDPVAQRARP
jgi:membrane associated rhomboid family serine protease